MVANAEKHSGDKTPILRKNGTLMAEGPMSPKGHPYGHWNFYDDTGLKLDHMIDFEPDGRTEIFTQLSAEGRVTQRYTIVDDVIHGIRETYHEDGVTVAVRERMVNGKITGVSESFYADGKRSSLTFYKRGVQNGLIIDYHPDGKTILKAGYYHKFTPKGAIVQFNENRFICGARYYLAGGLQDEKTSNYLYAELLKQQFVENNELMSLGEMERVEACFDRIAAVLPEWGAVYPPAALRQS